MSRARANEDQRARRTGALEAEDVFVLGVLGGEQAPGGVPLTVGDLIEGAVQWDAEALRARLGRLLELVDRCGQFYDKPPTRDLGEQPLLMFAVQEVCG